MRKHTPSDWAKDVSGGSTDVSWEWTDVGIPATKIRPLLNAGLISIVFSTNSSTYYSLVGRNVIKEALESPPTSTRLQPLMQEVHEKVTRNGGIESHAEAEANLLELGNLLGFDAYVTADDRNKEFWGKLLSETATLQEMPEDCIPPGIKDTVRHINVIWFKQKFPKYCIEVEHSTDITHGLLRLYRLKELKTSFMVVAPTGARDKFEREAEKAPFDSIRDSFRFNSYDDLTRFLAVAREFVGEKRNFLG